MKRFFTRLLEKRPDPAEPVRPLWHAIVREARDPAWYRNGGIADTLEGRYDAITLVTALVMIRMDRDSPLRETSARLTELFVMDMEGQLRESGMGDPTVGKKIGQLIGSLAGRIDAYRKALAAEDNDTLEAAVRRNVTLAEVGSDPGGARRVAERLRALHDRLARMDSKALMKGDIA